MIAELILITGSGRGIGRDAAIALAKRGYHVIATTHHQADADELTSVAKRENIRLESFVLDITSSKERERILKCDIDIIINNAAVAESGSLAEIDINKVRNNFEVNLFSTLELTQLVLRKMIRKDKGRIIFISSLLGRGTMEFLGSYSMTKFAVSSGAETLRKELSQITKNIHVSVVEPGAYHTGFNQKMLAKKFVCMDKNSYFFKIREKISRNEQFIFRYAEQKSTKSITAKIIEAVEDRNPKLRYVAPWWQGLIVQAQRIVGA